MPPTCQEESRRAALRVIIIKQDGAYVIGMPAPAILEEKATFRLEEAALFTLQRKLLAALEDVIFIKYETFKTFTSFGHPQPTHKKLISTRIMGSFRLEFVQESAAEMLLQQRQDALAQFIIVGQIVHAVQEKWVALEGVTIGERTYSQLLLVIKKIARSSK